MSNRGYSLPLLLWTLAGNANQVSAQTAALQVQVYDYASLKPAVLREFIGRTQAILVGAGVSVQVDACGNNPVEICGSQAAGSSKWVVIRVVAGASKSTKNVRHPPLGLSFAGHGGGTYASVFLQPVKDEADEASLPWVIVLSYAAAHEIGHLLLGDQAHTSRGLMKANWNTNDFLAMAQNHFHFSEEQTRELASRYGTVRLPETGLDVVQVRP
jgi:hypothetical protein